MTVLEVIQRSSEFLSRKGVESPRLQVELMLAHVLQMPRLKLYLDFNRVLSEADLAALRGMVQRRGAREPLQHILGSTSFCGLNLSVTPAVLVPRPETELLAERAWEFLRQYRTTDPSPARALDFGTGSGCLAVALAVHAPEAEIHAVDISEAALQVASHNALQHNVAGRIHFHAGNGFEALPKGLTFDLVVSNPPYIPTADIENLEPEVRAHDPREALDGGSDGLEYYRRLGVEAPRFLAREGKLMVEFGADQAETLLRIFASPHWIVDAVEKDYAKRPRILIAHRGI